MDLGDAAAEPGAPLHLGKLVREEEHLAVAHARDQRVFRIAIVLDQKAWIAHALLAAHALKIGLPALTVGWIGEHEIELAGGEGVVCQCRMLRAAHDVVGRVAFTLQQ